MKCSTPPKFNFAPPILCESLIKIPVVPVSRPTLFFSADPINFFNAIDRATLFSLGGCRLLIQRDKMVSVVTIIIEPKYQIAQIRP